MPPRRIKIVGCQPVEILGDIQRSASAILDYSREAEEAGAQLVCFPECFLQGYVVEAGHAKSLAISLSSARFAAILKQLEKLSLTIVFGMIEEQGGRFYLTAVVVKSGVLQGAYRKTQLLPGESKVFTPGSQYPVFDLDGIKFGINICYDLNFASCADQVAKQGGQLLVCPCNNMLKTQAANEWKDKHNVIRALRCQESKLWLLSSDVTGERDGRISYGPTAVIDPAGCVVAQAPLSQPGLVAYEIETR